jgi:hypothetical protein
MHSSSSSDENKIVNNNKKGTKIKHSFFSGLRQIGKSMKTSRTRRRRSIIKKQFGIFLPLLFSKKKVHESVRVFGNEGINTRPTRQSK